MGGLRKQVMCPACGVLVADAVYRRWPGNLTLTATEGYPIQPEGGAVQVRRAEQRVEHATSAGERERELARLDFLRRHLSELIYDLRCRNGHSTLRTMPQLVGAVRAARGQWVSLED